MINKIAKFFGCVVLQESEYDNLKGLKTKVEKLNQSLEESSSEIFKIREEKLAIQNELKYIKMEFISNPFFDKETAKEIEILNDELSSARKALTWILYSSLIITREKCIEEGSETFRFSSFYISNNGIPKHESIKYGNFNVHKGELERALANYRKILVNEHEKND